VTELNIEGMTCDHCQKAVKSALEGVDGVTAAEVDLETGRARVEGGADVTRLVAAVEDEGYRAEPAA
jgi:copper chaperone